MSQETRNDMLDEDWGMVVAAGENVKDSYDLLLDAIKTLADEMHYNKEYVLQKVMPKTAAEREDSKRIEAWLLSQRGEWEKYADERAKKRKRQQLIKRLNLTNTEKALLGIETEKAD